jgi:uncharacterized protein
MNKMNTQTIRGEHHPGTKVFMAPIRKVETYAFNQFGRHLLLDVKENKVYVIDNLKNKVLDFFKNPTECERAIEVLKKHYSIDSIVEALQFLKDNNLLVADADCSEKKEVEYQSFTNKFSLALNVSHACNLRCKYCYEDKPRIDLKSAFMTENVAKKSVDFILGFDEIESLGIAFYGGEPLLNFPVIKSIIAYANQRAEDLGMPEVEYHITTNGTLLNDDIIDFFRNHNMDILISLDGPSEIHDAMRVTPDGHGTHSTILNNLKKLMSIEGAHKVSASAVVTSGQGLKKAYEYLSQFEFENIKISYARYLGENEYTLNDSDVKAYIEDMTEIAEDCIDKNLNGIRPPYYDFETKILQLWKGSRRKYFCPAGIRRFGVSPDGGIYPCGVAAALDKYRIGDVYQGLDREKLNQLLYEISIENRKGCSTCWARYLCAGGCFLSLVRNFDDVRKCVINKINTMLAISIFAIVKEKNELLLSSLVDPTFLPNFYKMIYDENFSEPVYEGHHSC